MMHIETLDVASIALGGKVNAEYLVTREEGRLILSEIERQLYEQSQESILVLDFTNVKFIDLSGADEVIAKLASRVRSGEYGGRRVVVTNLTEQHLYNIERALQDKGLALLQVTNGTVSIIGALNKYLLETFMFVTQKVSTTARELADEANIPINTASTRLLNLFNEGLVARVEDSTVTGSRQYVYRSLGI